MAVRSFLVAVAMTLFVVVVVVVTENTREICRGNYCASSCTGAHCQGREGLAPSHLAPSSRLNGHRSHVPKRPVVPYTIISPHHVTVDAPRENPKSITAEVLKPGCTGRGCNAHGSPKPSNGTEQCKGLECKLGIRTKSKQNSCTEPDCPTGTNSGRSRPTFLHMQDRAEQVLEETTEFGFGHTGPERGGTPVGIQLTCDVKPGSNEVPSEDALVLQLRLAKGQEKLVEELKGQQMEIKQLQNRFVEQQSVLMDQQRQILEQQQRMFEQMEQVKNQYSLLLDNFRQVSFQSSHRDLAEHAGHLDPETSSRDREAYAMHKVEMEASVMELGRSLMRCGSCPADEYCDFSGGQPHCEKCTVCPAGFFLVSQCSIHADRICQDRDECLEIQNLCGEQDRCLNTPGGFRCTGLSVKEASSGACGHGYFYSMEMQECQACSECDSQVVVSPCSAMSDTMCSSLSETNLSLSWSGDVTLAHGSEFPNVQLQIKGDSDGNLVTCSDGWLVLHQHGLIWADHNVALRHGCRSFVQACMRLNASEEGGWDVSGVRIEQRDERSIQSGSVSGASAVEEGYMLALYLKSASHHCNPDNKQIHLESGLVSSFSLLWLSHDTGAVAMTAHSVASAHFHTNYRPTFRMSSISDPYMMGLTHDNRGVRFTEKGTVKFVLQQAVYSMGQACVSEGFHLLAFLNRNGSSSELTRAFKPGVHYRDTSISLSAAAAVEVGDSLTFEILAPAQCNVRYFGDDSGISMLSLLWIPSAVSSSISATISGKGIPSGAVRNKALLFRQTTPVVAQVQLTGRGDPQLRQNFVFKEAGTASVAINLRLIHSCSMIKLTLLEQAKQQGGQSKALAQQVGGPMPEGSEWTTMGLRVSFPVNNGTEVFSTVDCVRGRLNQISHNSGSRISILWTAV